MRILAVADMHLHYLPPPNFDGDWLHYLRDVFRWLKSQALPIVCAGDVLEVSGQPVWFVNFLIDQMAPLTFYAIPGQHDLPYHRLREVKRSAFYTLVRAGVLKPLKMLAVDGNRVLVGAAYGSPWRPARPGSVLVAHAYVDTQARPYLENPESYEATAVTRKLDELGYVFAIFGDNHIAFQSQRILNCGAFLGRRKGESQHAWVVDLARDPPQVEALEVPRWPRRVVSGDAEKAVVSGEEATFTYLRLLKGGEIQDPWTFLKRLAARAEGRVRQWLERALEEAKNHE